MHLTHLIRHVCRAFVGSSLLIPKLFGERFLLQLACARILLRVDERATSRIEKSRVKAHTLFHAVAQIVHDGQRVTDAVLV